MQEAGQGHQRILSLDVLRGVAILGILFMNIQHFSMPTAAYTNPTAYGDLEGINRWVWIMSHLLAQDKFMSLFSILFGAGVLLFNERALAKGAPDVILHYRRMGWLLVFGLVHGYFFWSGDILVCYSLCGMLVFLFRLKQVRSLLILSMVFFVVPLLLEAFFAWSLPYMPEGGRAEMLQGWKPDEARISVTLEAFRGRWAGRMAYRATETLFMQTAIFMMSIFWRVMAMMLLGMVLYRRGILSASLSTSFYTRMVLIGLPAGFALISLGIFMNFSNDWTMEYSMLHGSKYNYIGSVGVALGYLALVMLICRSQAWGGFKRLFARVGRMAFSNYIIQTLLATFVFYGYGLGLYGSVERKSQVLIMAAIWACNLLFSWLWLRHFRQGPLEWLWRRLTYGRSGGQTPSQ